MKSFCGRSIFGVAVLALGATFSCSGNKNGFGIPQDAGPPDAGRLDLSTLPDWPKFAVPVAKAGPAQVGSPINSHEVADVLDFTGVTKSGVPAAVQPKVLLDCATTTYTQSDNISTVAPFGVITKTMFLGALIQGGPYARSGALTALDIAERAPLSYTLKDLNNGAPQTTSGQIAMVNAIAVGQEISKYYMGKVAGGFGTTNSIDRHMEIFETEPQWGLLISVDGRSENFQAVNAANDVRTAPETTVTARFFEKMYSIDLQLPTMAAGLFSAAFTQDQFDSQVKMGTIGADNPPVVVSGVDYGRVMMVSVTSSASPDDIKTAITDSFNAGISGATAQLTPKDVAILQSAKLGISTLGGDTPSALAAIHDAQWKGFFTSGPVLDQMLPIAFRLTSVKDLVPAQVGQNVTYQAKQCNPSGTVSKAFQWLGENQASISVTPTTALLGDFNGDGLKDILWNERTTSANKVQLGLAHSTIANAVFTGDVPDGGVPDGGGGMGGSATPGGDGTFIAAAAVNHSVSQDWTGYSNVLVGDVDGDMKDDIVWVNLATGSVYVGFSMGDGTFAWGINTVIASANAVFIGDINGDKKADLTFTDGGPGSSSQTVTNRVAQSTGMRVAAAFTALAAQPTNASFFSDVAAANPFQGSGWGNFNVTGADINGDARLDLVFNWEEPHTANSGTPPFTNWVVTFAQVGNGSFTAVQWPPASSPLIMNFANFEGFRWLVGDANNDHRADMVWVNSSTGGLNPPGIRVALSQASAGVFDGTSPPSPLGGQALPKMGGIDLSTYNPPVLVDLNNDGRSDIVWNQLTASANATVVAISTPLPQDGTFDTSNPAFPNVNAAMWSKYVEMFGDMNGDGRTDLVFTSAAGGKASIFLGLSRLCPCVASK